MSDGITKQLRDYFEELSEVGEMAIESVKEQIDAETDRVEQELQRNTPQGKTGRLARSLTRTEEKTDKRYGYKLTYEGEDEYGNSYEKVANVLNYGSSTVRPKKFVTKAIKTLKGLDNRAAERFEEKTKDAGE